MEKPLYEVADVFAHSYPAFKINRRLPVHVKKVAKDIIECRTQQLGGHLNLCKQCKHIKIAYNSCRNRHCPKCQFAKREQWILDRQADLLPTKYFHVIFTLPHELNAWHIKYPPIMYDLLFKAAWKAIRTVVYGQYKKPVKMGMIALLHTWGQQLNLHPHLHCIIPAGVFYSKTKQWKGPQKQNLLCSIERLTQRYQQCYAELLLKAINKQLIDPKDLLIPKMKKVLTEKIFNVNIQPPFAKPDHVIQYLGRYSHKIAITNHRLVKVDRSTTSFRYKDYRDDTDKILTLDNTEFIRRFLSHVLPRGFMKIRHFGFLSNRAKNKDIDDILNSIKHSRNPKVIFDINLYFLTQLNIDLSRCQICQGQDKSNKYIIPKARSDPNHYNDLA